MVGVSGKHRLDAHARMWYICAVRSYPGECTEKILIKKGNVCVRTRQEVARSVMMKKTTTDSKSSEKDTGYTCDLHC